MAGWTPPDGISILVGHNKSGFLFDVSRSVPDSLYVPPHFYLARRIYDLDAQFVFVLNSSAVCCDLSGYASIAEKLGGVLNTAVAGGRVYREVGGVLTPASTDAARLGVLELIVSRSPYAVLLLDSPVDDIHPMYKIRAALLLHTAASLCGRKIVVATHDTHFKDVLANVDAALKNLKIEAKVPKAPVRLYTIRGGALEERDIGDKVEEYMEYYVLPYYKRGGEEDEQREDE